MIHAKNALPVNMIQWVAATGGVKKGQLVKSATGAAPVAAAHEGATLLGVTVADAAQATAATIIPLRGTLLEIDYRPGRTKMSCTAADLGVLYDMYVDSTTGEMFIDLDDTTGGYLFIVGYDNIKQKAFCVVDDADILLSI